MTTGALIVIAIRLLVPLAIFRWKLAGAVASMLVDAVDVVLVDVLNHGLGLGGFTVNYHQLDKILDSYYLTIEFIVALRWCSPYARLPAIALFLVRAAGVLAFEATHRRFVLFIFPNMFENWWLYCVATERFWPRLYPRSARTVAIPMVLLLIPKMAQEYVLHVAQAQPWNWIKHSVLHTE